MITFNFSIRNPFHNEALNPWRPIFQVEKPVSAHKVLEVEFTKYSYTLFDIGFSTNWSGADHAGPEFELSILGYEFRIALIDIRHWDHEKNTWAVYPS